MLVQLPLHVVGAVMLYAVILLPLLMRVPPHGLVQVQPFAVPLKGEAIADIVPATTLKLPEIGFRSSANVAFERISIAQVSPGSKISPTHPSPDPVNSKCVVLDKTADDNATVAISPVFFTTNPVALPYAGSDGPLTCMFVTEDGVMDKAAG